MVTVWSTIFYCQYDRFHFKFTHWWINPLQQIECFKTDVKTAFTECFFRPELRYFSFEMCVKPDYIILEIYSWSKVPVTTGEHDLEIQTESLHWSLKIMSLWFLEFFILFLFLAIWVWGFVFHNVVHHVFIAEAASRRCSVKNLLLNISKNLLENTCNGILFQ